MHIYLYISIYEVIVANTFMHTHNTKKPTNFHFMQAARRNKHTQIDHAEMILFVSPNAKTREAKDEETCARACWLFRVNKNNNIVNKCVRGVIVLYCTHAQVADLFATLHAVLHTYY